MAENETSKVTVKIYGQEYTFSSSKSKDELIRVANHVDEVMREIAGQGTRGSMSRIAILTAINVAGELAAEQGRSAEYDREKEQYEKDIAHYQQLWEEVKRSHVQYQADLKLVREQKETLRDELADAVTEKENLARIASEREETIAKLREELDSNIERKDAFKEELDAVRNERDNLLRVSDESDETVAKLREDLDSNIEQKESFREELDAVKSELYEIRAERDELARTSKESEEALAKLRDDMGIATNRLRSVSNQSQENGRLVSELKEKLKEIEGSYFEIQMDNIRLKGELEKFRKNP